MNVDTRTADNAGRRWGGVRGRTWGLLAIASTVVGLGAVPLMASASTPAFGCPAGTYQSWTESYDPPANTIWISNFPVTYVWVDTALGGYLFGDGTPMNNSTIDVLSRVGAPASKAGFCKNSPTTTTTTTTTTTRPSDHDVAGVDDDVAGVDHDVAGVDHDVAGVDHDVAGVDHDVAGVDHDVAGVDHDVAGVDHDVAGVDHDVAGVDHDHCVGGLSADPASARGVAANSAAAGDPAARDWRRRSVDCAASGARGSRWRSVPDQAKSTGRLIVSEFGPLSGVESPRPRVAGRTPFA